MRARSILAGFAAAVLGAAVAGASQTAARHADRNTIVLHHTRFEFLSPSTVRMEYSSTGHFVDAPTVVVVRRTQTPFKLTVRNDGAWRVFGTGKLTVRYLPGSGNLTSTNLRVDWTDQNGRHSWTPGDTDRANLGGISYSLDGVSSRRPPKYTPGLLSRSGYFVLDDSRSPVWNSDSAWIEARPDPGGQDFYLFVYGDAYEEVLKEFSDLCGKIPMIPRYALGPWFTDLNYQYLPQSELVTKHHYTDEDIRKEILRFRQEDIPMDILVLDFGWHLYGWKGGYDWSPIFPDPTGFLRWAHQNGVRVTANDHPGYGNETVLSDEDSHAPEVRRLLNMPVEPAPSFKVDITKGWRFHTDPTGAGQTEGWASTGFNDSTWQTLDGGMSWEKQGHEGYDGLGWYRKWVTVPDGDADTSLLLVFTGVDDQYDLFVNGSRVAHHGAPGASVWNSVTSTSIRPFVKAGGRALIALRVDDWGGDGGMQGEGFLCDRYPVSGIRFNLAVKKDAETFMNVLHNPLLDQGLDFWWIDGGSGSCRMEGLNSQLWTNRLFYDFSEQHSGKRGFVFSRYGGWGNQRYPGIFTGDTYSEWNVLGDEVEYTARGANVLQPYITHDIGGFLGRKISLDMYIRWIQFGTFSPILRLHSAFENPADGNVRLPWMYGAPGSDLARRFFQLRERLIPYIYTYCRTAYDEATSIVRPLYLEHPRLAEAYHHPHEYYFGDEMLVAPIVDSTTERDVYLPPDTWYDFFTGEKLQGGRVVQRTCDLSTMPVFVKSGAIIPMQTDMLYSDQRPPDTLLLAVYGRSRGAFTLYEDDGVSLQYQSGKSSRTSLVWEAMKGGGNRLTIGPAQGRFEGQVERRAWRVSVRDVLRPASVRLNGKPAVWRWDEGSRVLTVDVPLTRIREKIQIAVR